MSSSAPAAESADTAQRLPQGALHATYAQLYGEIKRVAHGRLAQSGGVVGLNTTALVHEGFLRLLDLPELQGTSRGQFFAYVGQVLRSVVIDYVRAEGRDKRGGQQCMVTMSAAEDLPGAYGNPVDLIAVDRALLRMREVDNDLYELIEAQTFAGLTIAELAAVRGVTERTVNRDLLKARALLAELLG